MVQICPAPFTDNQFRGEGDAGVLGGALDGLDQGADDHLSPAAAVVMDAGEAGDRIVGEVETVTADEGYVARD